MTSVFKKHYRQQLIFLFHEGKYLDFWTINHILPGILAALGAELLGLRFWTGFGITLTAMICWEIFEDYIRIKECLTNRLSDIVTGGMGFLATYFWILPLILNKLWLYLIFGGIIYILIGLLGYLAYKLELKNKN
jgi:hypothetical protein